MNLFGGAILTGGLILTEAALRPGLAGLPLSVGVLAQQPVVALATLYMPLCGACTAISAVLLIKRKILTRQSKRLYLIGLGIMITVGLTSAYMGAVMDKEIAGWRVDVLATPSSAQVSFFDKTGLGGRYRDVWDTWGALNAFRTVGAVMALTLFILANLQPRVLERDD